MFKKLSEWIAPSEAGEEEEVVVPTPEKRRTESLRGANVISATDTKMVLFEPRSFDDAQVIAKKLKENRAAVINLQKLRTDAAQRTIDFLSGVLFALDGRITQVGEKVFLLTPKNVPVDGDIAGSGEPQE